MAKAKTTTVKARPPALSETELVNDFLKKVDHPLKRAMEELRQIILGAHPGISEHIKWNAPSFCYQGDDRMTFNLHKKECILIVFHRGAKAKEKKGKNQLFTDPTGLMDWVSNDRALIRLGSPEEVITKQGELKKIVRLWLKYTSIQ